MWDLIVSVPDHCLSFYFENAIRELFIMHLQKETRLVIIRKCTFKLKTSLSLKAGGYILNSHLALFQPSKIRKEDSKPSHIA